ncbi:MBL fold metallo-hydrolase [Lysobacteraceae bacterium NML75-0749]|nr:MBL fold metallo-hydrolase [Xanthomonadaceae bacterium NML75-0749]PJK00350.1 MBL fold metallo-hydrolase [Xanthomonadaceae bacterium NML03-0222]PJK05092.1 MBL fold metallo-hydrolase [Xanthomonadaceae bacterium NML71-0210]PJK05713.1 MBL fold metallo-hydrolase [Xanthomonadaceae bacterium NML91-0268]
MRSGTVLFENENHLCVVFSDLVPGEDGVQANQFLVVDHGQAALIDPGGDLLYTPLWLAITGYAQLQDIRWILTSHQDPDVVGAVGRWLANTPSQVVCSRLWGRFVPHNVSNYQQGELGEDRYCMISDGGGKVPLGRSFMYALPGHFMHSVGNFCFYDPVSRILFSGDIGSSLIPNSEKYQFVSDFEKHLTRMVGFHRRYMTSNRVLKLWVSMVRQLNPSMIVPQHGLPMKGEQMNAFLSWLYDLECGVDLLRPEHYSLDVLKAAGMPV